MKKAKGSHGSSVKWTKEERDMRQACADSGIGLDRPDSLPVFTWQGNAYVCSQCGWIASSSITDSIAAMCASAYACSQHCRSEHPEAYAIIQQAANNKE